MTAMREALHRMSAAATQVSLLLRDIADLRLRVPAVTQRSFTSDGCVEVSLICLRHSLKISVKLCAALDDAGGRQLRAQLCTHQVLCPRGADTLPLPAIERAVRSSAAGGTCVSAACSNIWQELLALQLAPGPPDAQMVAKLQQLYAGLSVEGAPQPADSAATASLGACEPAREGLGTIETRPRVAERAAAVDGARSVAGDDGRTSVIDGEPRRDAMSPAGPGNRMHLLDAGAAGADMESFENDENRRSAQTESDGHSREKDSATCALTGPFPAGSTVGGGKAQVEQVLTAQAEPQLRCWQNPLFG